MSFFQEPPRLANQYDDDALVREQLERTLPAEVLRGIDGELRELGELAGGRLYQLQLEDRLNEPRLVQFDPWGRRIDRIELTPLWREAAPLAARFGLVAAAYEKRFGPWARTHQFALDYVVEPSLDVYSCPLAMTDGAARTLLEHGNAALIERAVPRLTTRDPALMWTSGQWMTERTGGSDVGLSQTVATRDGDRWRLSGVKWFTSAATSEVALTLARPEGNAPGGRGLALFYLETRLPSGELNGIRIERLKDKLGTRKLPTAELTLEGTLATPVAGLADGVRNISPMLNVTRLWNSVSAVAGMRRAIALATDYARRRTAFGANLAQQPLHLDTLAGLEAEREAALVLVFRAIELMGRVEAREASAQDAALLRALTPVIKLTTARQAVAVTSEALECFGGAGYVEDTGLPRLLRDAQVLSIWEGTTNVLSLDVLRALSAPGALEGVGAELERQLRGAKRAELASAVAASRAAFEQAVAWRAAQRESPARLQAGARRFALTLGRALELACLAAHAQWCLESGRGKRALLAARRFAANGVDLIGSSDRSDLSDASDLLGLSEQG